VAAPAEKITLWRVDAEKGVFTRYCQIKGIACKFHGSLRIIRSGNGNSGPDHVFGFRKKRFGAQIHQWLANFVVRVRSHCVLEGQGLPLVAVRVHIRQIIGDKIHAMLCREGAKKTAKHCVLHYKTPFLRQCFRNPGG
jgi:hypothetical protein